MTVRITHIVVAFIAVVVLVGGAFTFGMKWGGNPESQGATVAEAIDKEEFSEPNEEDGMAEGAEPTYAVTKIIDGDTIAVSIDGKTETVRLIGIDTPETVDTRVEVQCFGAESFAKLRSLLTNRKVSLEIDEGEGERDKYKRLLAYVFRDDGLFINKYMVEEGYAYEYTYDTAYHYQKEFRAAETAAKNAQKGLWAPDACPAETPQPAATKPQVKGTTSTQTEAAATPAAVTQEQTAQTETQAQQSREPEHEPEPTTPPSGSYTCSSNKYNCSDFSTHAEAQAVFEQCGGVDNDVHKLDSNKDGEACESLP
ncbi:MAG TPA: thermonuclease family protein [Candidatus Paceibacterota bacterium]|nr:thermonuclease family protein [Candidatus Paceibacterota bacterium]